MLEIVVQEALELMPKAEARKKRPYMASQQRRQALLDVATEIVCRDGWSALTMKGLATEAGVSRQLVYDHFEDGSRLLLSTIERLFEDSHRSTAEVLQSNRGDIPATIREAYRIFLGMSPGQRRALRAISGDFVSDQPEARKAATMMREQILALWLPYARRQTGLPESELRPRMWMLVSASWGLADLVDDGTLSDQQATEMLAHFVEQTMARGRGPGKRRKAATSPRSRTRKHPGRGDPHE
jgi:AcrR family transcriptional regulator